MIMPPEIVFFVNGEPAKAQAGESILTALMNEGRLAFRREDGQTHSPICGMGVCFECLVRVPERGLIRACMTPVEAEMVVEID